MVYRSQSAFPGCRIETLPFGSVRFRLIAGGPTSPNCENDYPRTTLRTERIGPHRVVVSGALSVVESLSLAGFVIESDSATPSTLASQRLDS